jgi:hypothetical protein
MKKFLFGLAPVLAVAAFALVPSGASAVPVQCRVLADAAAQHFGVECNNPPGVVEPQNLRENNDGVSTSPQSTNYGTDGFAVNTAGKLRFCATSALLGRICNSNPAGYAFFGLKLFTNPESSATVCRRAEGNIPWVDIQRATSSPVFDGALSAWTFSVNSDNAGCSSTQKGVVTVRNASLLFETLAAGGPVIATGTFKGVWSQPSSAAGKCPAGGIEINKVQSGITTEPETTAIEIDNGEATPAPAFICFVSANNYLYPDTAPVWAPFTGAIWKN